MTRREGNRHEQEKNERREKPEKHRIERERGRKPDTHTWRNKQGEPARKQGCKTQQKTERKPEEQANTGDKVNTDRTKREERITQRRDEEQETDKKHTESREEAEKKRRLRNRGEGMPIAERRALIFFQNSSNKTQPRDKLLSLPSL